MNDGEMVEGRHIVFEYRGILPGQKTRRWDVLSKYDDAGRLGEIKWFARWRKYSFFPADGCIFEEVCLREISAFIVDRTKDHKYCEKTQGMIPQPPTLER